MTFKLPEPNYFARAYFYAITSNGSHYTRAQLAHYTRDQLIQAIKDWSEEMASMCERSAWMPTIAAATAIREKAMELK